ncbi:MAG: recombinase family protein [Endomicrobium sp.]|nr:recombinase family protein [Endomicrobium sp.]
MKETEKPQIKCAIYTRKSSEEGLELEFNSLQAQREACEAYIKSQKHEGWVLVEKQYDDGGFSGGTIERPALKELLKDIENDLVNIIIVYKIDRLTRSLHDFSKIVDVFDKKQASFVSITQQFNTTTSMGRLTLNMLLSFAQFEREVTGERIRDKYAASKKKGMWMGGSPPMGYYRKDKKIYPSEHAKSVQIIFNKYLELRSVANVKHWLDDNNITSQTGKRLSVGNVNSILLNRAFIGEVGHNGVWYKGEHEGIIDIEVFNKVQEVMADNRVERAEYKPTHSLLSGKIFDDKGNYMSPARSTGSKGKKHRYYVSQAIIRHEKSKVGNITKISAYEIEKFIDDWFAEIFNNKAEILKLYDNLNVDEQKIFIANFQSYTITRDITKFLIKKVQVFKNEITLTISKMQIIELLRSIYEGYKMKVLPAEYLNEEITFAKSYKIAIIDNGSKIIMGSFYNQAVNKNQTLIKAILMSYRWNKQILYENKTFQQIADENTVSTRYVEKILQLSFLSPKIVTAILQGTQPQNLLIKHILNIKTLDWQEQSDIINI